jgi:RHS repeat-associated protein
MTPKSSGKNSHVSLSDNSGTDLCAAPLSRTGPVVAEIFKRAEGRGAMLKRMNRLLRVREHRENENSQNDLQQQYVYDRFGNRTIDQNPANTFGVGIPKPDFVVTTANNRLGVPSNQSGEMLYDSVGNLTKDTYKSDAITRAYDAENRMTSETQTNRTVAYTYDGGGKRIKRVVGSNETWQVYGIGGELLAEYESGGAAATPQKEYGYRNGQLLITADGVAAPVGWTNTVKVSVSDNSITKTAVGLSAWNAGAVSEKGIDYGDGYMEFTVSETNKARRAGLSNGDTNQNWNDIDYCIFLEANGNVSINEGSNLRGNFGTYSSGDKFRVSVENGVVTYRRNGALLYTSTVSPQYPLIVDTSLYTNGATINDVVVFPLNLRWLVTDQLGTPRMIFDQSGSLTVTDQNGNYVSGMTRHDYLPFGEELFAGTGGRTMAQGYAANDNVRQQFTSQERDIETGLDYFVARYYGSTLGRFTSADSVLGTASNPQSLNLYAHTLNNPLRFTDPTGHSPTDGNAMGPDWQYWDLVYEGVIQDTQQLQNQPKSPPVIPPFDSWVAGSPLYQKQNGQCSATKRNRDSRYGGTPR